MAEIKAVKFLGDQTQSVMDVQGAGGPVKAVRFLGSEPPPIFAKAKEIVVPAILPTAGQIGGGILGGLATSPTIGGVPAGVLAGEAAGGALGEAANQALGITEPSPTQVGLAAAGGPAGRAIGGALGVGKRLLGKVLPGSAGARHELAKEGMEQVSKRLLPSNPSEALYDLVEQAGNPSIPAAKLTEAADKLLSTEAMMGKGLQNSEVAKVAESLKTLAATPDGIPFQQLRANLRRIGQRVGKTAKDGGEEHGAYKLLKKAAMEDLEAAAEAGTNAGTLLKEANRAAAREFAADDLAEVVQKAWQTDAGGRISVNPKTVLQFLQKDTTQNELFRKAVPPEERKALIQFFTEMAKDLPKLPPPKGAMYGSGVVAGRTLGAGGLGYYMGLDERDAALVGAAAAAGPMLIARAVMTEPGKALIKRMLATSPYLDHRHLAVLASFLRSQSGERGPRLKGNDQ